ncbi:MAG: DNA methyltransferase [Candidatus Edwardsbacteria bacterium]|nr:DNA methyltransferase [Candidatus Edwardsbacteria bacterium]
MKTGEAAMLQTEMFEKSYVDHYKENKIGFEFPTVSDVTFLNGLSEGVHRWFRLTPSYSPELVRYMVDELGCTKNKIVLDPFLGKGTTAIELKKLGRSFIGVEINPLLKMVSEYALTWNIKVDNFEEHYQSTINNISKTLTKHKNSDIDKLVNYNIIKVPKIHDVFRWWNKEALKELLLIKNIIYQTKDKEYIKLYWIALCSSALDCANIHRNHPTISFDDNHNRDINVLHDLRENIEHIINDLNNLPKKTQWGTGEILLGDSTKLKDYLLDNKVDRVITSPPYPNRFSYVHTTRPQLFFMDIFNNPTQSAELDCAAVGGTWGKATSILYNDIVEPKDSIKNILRPIIGELRPLSKR